MRKLNVHIEKLISDLKKEGISFYFDETTQKLKTNTGIIDKIDDYVDKRLENVVFKKGDIEYKIYEGIFFRETGQSHYFKSISTKKGNEYEITVLDDKTFYEMQKILIQKYFE